jgi:NitT/TauT family transport system ATP-binding protein
MAVYKLFTSDRLVILSPKPTQIIDIIKIDLPRPRSINVFSDPTFIKIKQQAIDLVAIPL